MAPRALAVEIAVQDAEGAHVALGAGAARVELCTGLGLGGLTPSPAVVEAVVATGIPTHVLVRPRGGGFTYSAGEVTVMVRDIEWIVDAGAAGVVIGALTPGRGLDRHAMKALVRAAEGRTVTVHRCLDVVPDPVAALEEVAALGAARVLTSGGAVTAPEGAETLERMVAAAGAGVEIMAGGGVTPEAIDGLAATGVAAVHLSARRGVSDAGPAGPGGGPAWHDVTDEAQVRAAVAVAANARG